MLPSPAVGNTPSCKILASLLCTEALLHVDMCVRHTRWFVIAGIFVLAPLNGYILDKLGYGFVLIFINSLSLSAVVLQSIPVVQLQVCP